MTILETFTVVGLHSTEPTELPVDLAVPVGEAAYWANRCCELVGKLKAAIWITDSSNLPYLGFVAQPDDTLAWTLRRGG